MVDEINPVKCVHLAATNKRAYTDYHYQIYYQHIKQSPSAKYLGVTIDQHLMWKNHINEICNKANTAKAFLRRNLYHCPILIKSNCYKSLVRPILEYAATVW